MTIVEKSVRFIPDDGKPGHHCVDSTKSGKPCKSYGPFYMDDDGKVRCRGHSNCPEARMFRENSKNAGKAAGDAQRGIPWALRSKKTKRKSPHDPDPFTGEITSSKMPKVLQFKEAATSAEKGHWPSKPDMETAAGIRACIAAVAQNLAYGKWDDRKSKAMNDILKTALNAIDDRNSAVETPTEKLLLELVQKA